MTYTKIKFYIIGHDVELVKFSISWSIFFPRKNNKNLMIFKNGLLCLYDVSIVVLIDFIAILLTPGIFLIQIVNKNNTNMYLIHFHSKNIKMNFPKDGLLKFKPTTSIHYPSQRGEINCIGISKDFTTDFRWHIKKKKL